MRQVFVKPENALQRAEELLQVNSPLEALNVLNESLNAKRARNVPPITLEPLVLKFLSLAVIHQRYRMAREGLHFYKNVVQSSSVPSVVKVVTHFIECSEQQLSERVNDGEEIDDLEASETYETHFEYVLSSLGQQKLNFVVQEDGYASRMKFLWEAYRTVLDLLRNNSKLEELYQTTAVKAFEFCVRYKRKNEFRRLCDTLRSHVGAISGSKAQVNIDLADPEVLERFLDTRFVQLETATDLEMGQEGFRSAEDIFDLMTLAGEKICQANNIDRSQPKDILPVLFVHPEKATKMMDMLVKYYKKLTQVFATSDSNYFLSCAWSKYFLWASNKNSCVLLSEEDKINIANHIVLSALSSPIYHTTVPDLHVRFNRKKRLTEMLGLTKIPDRKSLLDDAEKNNLFCRVSETVKKLYEELELLFHPLFAAKKIFMLLSSLKEENPEYQIYLSGIKTVTLNKILRQVSSYYTTMTFEKIMKITETTNMFHLEQEIMKGNKRNEFRIKVNHLLCILEFKMIETPALLLDFLTFKNKQECFSSARESMEEQHSICHSRQQEIEDLKCRAEDKKGLLLEKKTFKPLIDPEEQKKIQLDKEMQQVNRKEARKTAETYFQNNGFFINPADIEFLDCEGVMELYKSHLLHDRSNIELKSKQVAKEKDYLVRAIRKNESKVLLDSYSESQNNQNKQIQQKAIHEYNEKFKLEMEIYSRVQKMQQESQKFVEFIENRYAVEESRTKSKMQKELKNQKNILLEKTKEAFISYRDAELEKRKKEQEEQRESIRGKYEFRSDVKPIFDTSFQRGSEAPIRNEKPADFNRGSELKPTTKYVKTFREKIEISREKPREPPKKVEEGGWRRQ